MCDDLDLEGVRRWFYGGTPPSEDLPGDGGLTGGWHDLHRGDSPALAPVAHAVMEPAEPESELLVV